MELYIGDQVGLPDEGDGVDVGTVESWDDGWFVRINETGELTGPWSDDELSKTGSRQANELMGYPEDDMMEEDDEMEPGEVPVANSVASVLPAQNRVSDWRDRYKRAFHGNPVSGYTNWDTFEVAMYVENHYDIYQATEAAASREVLAEIAEPMIRAKPEYQDMAYDGGYIEWSNVDWADVYDGRFTT